jgi:predicted Fe-Mo cluster-binding NifX family protein
MKVAISTSQGGIEDIIFPVFGRCPTFTIVGSLEKMEGVQILQNPGAMAGGGAGIAAAQAVVGSGAEAVITGSCGPNALAVLLASGINVYSASGNVKEALIALKAGKLSPINSPTSLPHAGMRFGGGMGRGGRRGRP